MPKYIIKLEDNGQAYYLEWSTIVDAATTYGMPLEEFREYYQHRYGTEGMRELEERLSRVDLKGTSAMLDKSVDETIACNRAGPDESCLSKEQIIDKYIRNRPEEDE